MQTDDPTAAIRRSHWTSAYLVPGSAALWCAILAPVQSLIWNGANAPSWISAMTPVHDAARLLYDAASSPGDQPYDFFGRLFLPVYAGAFFGFARARLSALGRIGRMLRALVLFALAAGLAGDFIAYWLAGRSNDALRAIGFWWIEVPSLGVAIIGVATLGIVALRAGARSAGASLAATPVVALGTTAALQYMPHGPMLALALAAVLVQAVRVGEATVEISR
jgi:hypothetical protein